ncbi:MAG: tRNA epoxyqueuosine(34) reductase QueG, partial [Terriglobia bacterium]
MQRRVSLFRNAATLRRPGTQGAELQDNSALPAAGVLRSTARQGPTHWFRAVAGAILWAVDIRETLKQRALDTGFDLVGIAPVEAPDDLSFARNWVEAGYGGEMQYLSNPKRDDPRLVLPSAQSIICVGLVYNTRWPYSRPGAATGTRKQQSNGERHAGFSAPSSRLGWISRYAWGRDYHDVMRGKLEMLRREIEALAPKVETRVYTDTGPVIERAFARRSGIGWMGKNTCLINQQKGSWFFLGIVLTNLALAPDLPAPDRCGSCTRCIEACPTGALTEPYRMDATRCISYLTIELKGAVPEALRPA